MNLDDSWITAIHCQIKCGFGNLNQNRHRACTCLKKKRDDLQRNNKNCEADAACPHAGTSMDIANNETRHPNPGIPASNESGMHEDDGQCLGIRNPPKKKGREGSSTENSHEDFTRNFWLFFGLHSWTLRQRHPEEEVPFSGRSCLVNELGRTP